MTLSRMVKPLIGIVVIPIVGWAMWLSASEPLFGRPYGQPAGQASAPSLFHVSAKGDHQAQGGER